MSLNLTILVVMGVLYAVGVYMLLERSLTRVLLGIMLLTNGTNLLLLHTGGLPGRSPLYDSGLDPRAYSDPLPQALVLTAIVITLGMTAFVLALAHRGRQLSCVDLVTDDTESARIHARAEADDTGSPSARDVADQIAAEGERTESRYHDGEGGGEL